MKNTPTEMTTIQATFEKKKPLFLFLYVFFSSILVWVLKPTYLYSLLIVILPPSIINFLWLKNSRGPILIFSIIALVFFAPAVELISRLANAWDVQSTIPRILGIMPVENLIFAFLNFLWGLSFYKYFIDKSEKKIISSKFLSLTILFIIFSSITFSLYFINPKLITANYHIVGLIFLVIPELFIFSQNPGLLKKTIFPTLFFACVFFIYEIVAIDIGNWWWPGEYIFPINLGGHIFPIDDVIIWYLLSTPALIGGFEYFMDDFR